MEKAVLTFKNKSGKLIYKPKTKEDAIHIEQKRMLKIAMLIDDFNKKFGTSLDIFDNNKITHDIEREAIIMSRKIREIYNL